MKDIFLFTLILFSSISYAQEFTSYKKPYIQKLYSKALKDTVEIEITIPINTNNDNINSYPVIYLLDKQLKINNKYNLHTIDYLTTLEIIPNSIIIGIEFSNKNRNKWTTPNKHGGKAEELIFFIKEELNEKLKEKYPISNFNLLIGHSRTAIFSNYALSKNYSFFNGIIANSNSYFDFGSTYEKEIFEDFLKSIDSNSYKYFLYFSSGESEYGDLHEESVDKLNTYLKKSSLPYSLEWKHYKFKVDHSQTPGLTVNQSLSSIFKKYNNRINNCFNILNDPKYSNKIPWEEYENIYKIISKELGYSIKPTKTFYNSIASGYYNDYLKLFKEKNIEFSIEVLSRAMKSYPNDYEFSSWLSKLYFISNDSINGVIWSEKSIKLVEINKSLSKEEKTQLKEEIKSINPKN